MLDAVSLTVLLVALIGTLLSASSLYFYSLEKKRRKRKFTVFINNMAFKIEAPANAKTGEIEAVKKMFKKMSKKPA